MDALREFIEGRVPNEWVRVPGKEVAFEREGVRVEARRTANPRQFGQTWEIRCRRSAGEAVREQTVRYVSSREAAVEGLYDCIRRVENGERLAEPDVANGSLPTVGYTADTAAEVTAAEASSQVEPSG
ncbi:hypothetical protein AUR64_00130 [Haloprofundus marisrubri]|uniref:Uncharacterized protein n=1 Tax=Haloprofundus marisrubri TaxID=1514971 RepID=A0A0W1RG47_9EURY|nr:hypothetical protein [Haloprofundus marisrubri]KTG11636.1 hypothetical protein AUR64_00130 [Haloprofundus marisrubri]